ncbi:hypothetical protein JW935_05240 [candidate division KSB1 bacterium]|nr:hypothetical protein [candidate division KSB1 bacterium]
MSLDRVLCIASNDSGHKLIGTEYDGLLMYNDVDWFKYGTVIPELEGGLISSMALYDKGAIWFTSCYGGLVKLDGFNQYTYEPDKSGLPHINARVVVIDEKNTKWIVTDIGLAAFNEDWIVDVEHNRDLSPHNFTLKQNFPNPFNPATIIGYSLQKSDKISLNIYNLTGQEKDDSFIQTLSRDFALAFCKYLTYYINNTVIPLQRTFSPLHPFIMHMPEKNLHAKKKLNHYSSA